MYTGVPIAIPVWVSLVPPATVTARAIPKSATTARPPLSRMFSGLMSRWTMPSSWATASASATWVVIEMASSSGSCRSRSSRSPERLPLMNGMTQ